jgi:hypothetical protein
VGGLLESIGKIPADIRVAPSSCTTDIPALASSPALEETQMRLDLRGIIWFFCGGR